MLTAIAVVSIAALVGVGLAAAYMWPTIQLGVLTAKKNTTMVHERVIMAAMYQYSVEHDGSFPDADTSTEVFQKLLDGNYASDPEIFYLDMPGKTKPVPGSKLKPENVCFDVTSGVKSTSSGFVPVVFTTGFSATYSSGAAAPPDTGVAKPFPGMAVTYKNGDAACLDERPDGAVSKFVPFSFDSGDDAFRQLKP